MDPVISHIVALLAGALLGAVVAYAIAHRRTAAIRDEMVRLQARSEAAAETAAERQALLEQAQVQLANNFRELASSALQQNSDQFLKLARENLQQHQVKAHSELEKREKAVSDLVKPIQNALEKTGEEMRRIEKERVEAYGALTRHIETMAESQRLLQSETRNLVQALRRPEVRGQWGEMTLKRLAELAGMVQYCDFEEQPTVRGEDGRQRPDMVVRMPDGRDIVVDAKTPLDAYLTAVETSDERERQEALARHARKVRERVNELAAKSYWQQFPNAPDFVVLFIPGEQFLGAALDVDRSLLEDALRDKVILATPTSFVALLRAVGYGWRQLALAKNAERIREVGEELYRRLTTFGDYLGKLGRALDSSVNHFNRAVGSFDSRILPSARKFTEMGVSAAKELETPEQIEKGIRSVAGRDSD